MSEEKKDYVIIGWTDSAMTVQNMPILRNATQFFAYHATILNWQLKPIPIQKKISRFTILRDPYERWLSGFTADIKVFIMSRDNPDEKTYLTNLCNSNYNWFLDFIFDHDVMHFDTHAELQCKQIELALEMFDQDKITFFKMTDTLGYHINHWLHDEGCRNKFNNGKINTTDKNNDIIYKKISTYMMDGKNLKRKEKILEYLKPDYKLYNSVKFINPT